MVARRKRPARRTVRRPYGEGSWFAVPLLRGGFGVGLVARIGKGGLLLGYFFGPARKSIPRPEDVRGFKPRQAVLILRFDDFYLRKGKWPIVGGMSSWERAEWPLPAFGFIQPLTGIPLRREYSESNVETKVSETHTTAEEVNRLPGDGSWGAGAVEVVLSRALGQRLDVPSTDTANAILGTPRARTTRDTPRARGKTRPVRAGKTWTYVTIAVPTKADKKRIYLLEDALGEAGVTFDASWDYETRSREWALDWSLEGTSSPGDVVERLRKSGLDFVVRLRPSRR